MSKNNNVGIDESEVIQLIDIDDAEKEFGEAIASTISNDKVVSWAKFVLTDDKPNANRQRIPFEEFDNILKTGAYKPVKMAIGEIKDGHEEAKPLGVITNLKVEGNKIIALAALWDHERGSDVSHIKELMASKKPVNVSWEILYSASKNINGVSDLLDVALKAVTIVGLPAYAGRTQLIAVAAKKWSPAYIEGLSDESFLLIDKDGTRYFPYRDDSGKIDLGRIPEILDEISQAPIEIDTQKSIRHQVNKMKSVIQADAGLMELLMDDTNTEEYTLDTKDLESKVTELTSQLAIANNTVATKEAELATAQEAARLATEKASTLEQEIAPLREFKTQADEATQREEKLSAIKAKFEGLKVEKPAEYFSENADKLLSLDENGLDFMLQELVAFKESEPQGSGQASVRNSSGVPNIPGKGGQPSISDMAAALRERNKK